MGKQQWISGFAERLIALQPGLRSGQATLIACNEYYDAGDLSPEDAALIFLATVAEDDRWRDAAQHTDRLLSRLLSRPQPGARA